MTFKKNPNNLCFSITEFLEIKGWGLHQHSLCQYHNLSEKAKGHFQWDASKAEAALQHSVSYLIP